MMKEELNQIKAKDGSLLALWKIYTDKSKTNKNIFLSHGTFSNRKVCMGISSYLANLGYQCWILEWRDHGESKAAPTSFNFETIAKDDFKTALHFLTKVKKINTLDSITHSGGGICLSIFLIENPEYQKHFNSITFFACQAFGANTNWINYLKISVGKYLNQLLGFTPARFTGSPHNEKYPLMKQWYNWNLSHSFTGENGINYLQKLKNIRIPILSICSTGDEFIAPPQGCKKYMDAFQNPNNKLLVVSKKNGFAENYNHSRILHSQNAKKEIYPKVLDWISKK